MSNTELTKFYLGLNAQTQQMPEVGYFDIISALNTHFNGQWTWELADEKLVLDGQSILTTVTVFIPGKVLTGRSLCKIKDCHQNHLFAIMDACQSFIIKNTVNQNGNQTTQPNQMTPEQISAAINSNTQNNNEMINTSAQFYNYKENGMPADGVPFDKMTDNCHNEMAQEMGMLPPTPQPQMNNDNGAIAYDAPNPALKGFSQKQIDGLKKFQKDFEIVNDEMFGNYVNTWNNNLRTKKDITPSNADAFLSWVDNLGKQGC